MTRNGRLVDGVSMACGSLYSVYVIALVNRTDADKRGRPLNVACFAYGAWRMARRSAAYRLSLIEAYRLRMYESTPPFSSTIPSAESSGIHTSGPTTSPMATTQLLPLGKFLGLHLSPPSPTLEISG